MDFSYIKAIHIVFVVSWFAGLFYLVRLFIYTAEAQKKEPPAQQILTQQFLQMQKKLLFIITWPGAIGTMVFGFWMYFFSNERFTYYFSQPWMWLKLIFVGLLFLYLIQCHIIYNQQKQGVFKRSSLALRLFNELATVFLVAIVFLVVVKSTGSLVWSLLGLFVFAGILMLIVFVYRKSQIAEEQKKIGKPKEDQKSDQGKTTAT